MLFGNLNVTLQQLIFLLGKINYVSKIVLVHHFGFEFRVRTHSGNPPTSGNCIFEGEFYCK
jgi:hypothetical protein